MRASARALCGRRVALLVRGSEQQLQRMDRPLQLLGQYRMDTALPLDPALADEALRHDLQPKMRLLATLRAGMVAGVKMRIIKNC